MDVNKVEYNGDTLIDLTGDTVTPQSLLSGATAHDASGASITGTVDLSTKADKVANATSGNFAGLDANGNLTDSRKKSSDFEPLIFFGTLAEWNALTDAEKAKYRTLKIPDTRVSDIEALIPSTATSSNKLATASDVAAKQAQITQSSLLTLTVAGWDSTTLQQTVTFAHDTTKWNVIDITLGEVQAWADCGVIAISETAAGITFQCDTVPDTALTFRVTSMEVS